MTVAGDPLFQFGMMSGGSAMLGGVLGVATKKFIRLIVVLVGFEVGLLLFLDHYRLIDVHWQALGHTLATASTSARWLPSWLLAEGTLPVGASLIGGFYIGFTKA